MKALITQLYLTQLCVSSLDCSPPGSFALETLQAIVLEWVAIPFSQGIFLTEESNPESPTLRQILYHPNHQGSPGLSLLGRIHVLLAYL